MLKPFVLKQPDGFRTLCFSRVAHDNEKIERLPENQRYKLKSEKQGKFALFCDGPRKRGPSQNR